MFHSYEDQIAAVKKQYNNEQMFHTMDETRERGEQIAELAEDYAPKTRKEAKRECATINRCISESTFAHMEIPLDVDVENLYMVDVPELERSEISYVESVVALMKRASEQEKGKKIELKYKRL